MPNLACLTCSNQPMVCPSMRQKRFLVSKQSLAECVQHVPLLWWGLFRKNDLRTETFEAHGEEQVGFAPVCEKGNALEQLQNAVPVLANAFPKLKRLEEWAEQFTRYVNGIKYKYLTIEWGGIEGLDHPPQGFKDMATLALRGFAQPEHISYRSDDVHCIHPLTRQPFILPGIQATSFRELLIVLTGIKESTREHAWNKAKTLGERNDPWE